MLTSGHQWFTDERFYANVIDVKIEFCEWILCFWNADQGSVWACCIEASEF